MSEEIIARLGSVKNPIVVAHEVGTKNNSESVDAVSHKSMR